MSNPDPQPKKIIFNKYELGRLLGCGAFAKVYHARTLPRPSTTASSNSHSSTTSVAIKIISKSRVAKSNQAHHITREMSILRRLRHPHIIRLIEVLASKTKIFFVLEFAKGGELFAKISKHGRCPEDQTRKLFQQLISAVGYCHSRGVFHRDLKPENLLLDEHGDLKVTDFGLSALTDQTRADGMFHTLCGTPAYVAPEILIKNGYDGAKVDVWSCGVILYVLNAGYLPFNDPNLMNMYRKIYRGEYRVPKWTSPELKSLLSRLLDTNPQTRIRVDEILDDPWFKKGLDEKKFKTMMSFHNEEEKDEELNFEERDVNAFDLILMSRGVNLLGLFETGSEKKERFVAGLEEAEGILGKVEEVGMREGCVVKRKGQNGKLGVVMRGRNGNLVAMVVVYRLTTGGCAVVEIEKGDSRWAREFWEEKLKSVFTVGQGQVAGEGSSGDREVPVL